MEALRLSEIQPDREYLQNCLRDLIGTDSPVGFYERIVPVMERYAAELGLTLTQDRKHTLYLSLEGKDSSRTIMSGAHLDTLGAVVRRIDADGSLRVRPLGGVNFYSLDGESVRVYTRDGHIYTGLMVCQSHDTHVFDDARSLARDENTMLVRLDERVSSPADVEALGIRHGDVVAFEPHFEALENGYIISRFLDDKAGVAAVLTALLWMKQHSVRPAYRTLLAFSFYEEIGHGGSYIPPEVEEFAAIDIGLIGPDYDGTEEGVSICAKDKFSPYDRDLTSRLIRIAENGGLRHAVDVYHRYGSDAHAALRGGANIADALFGMPCYASHGVERMHIKGIEETARLLIGYLISEKE
ncbi:MAG: M42 family metallopeptidase [Eubacteriales bacterium]|nr:M42 family metallopeptidase [Eubacteriales bacterium]